MRNNVLYIFIRQNEAILVNGKLVRFMLKGIEYQRLFYWQQHLEILFCFYFIRAYKFCSISKLNIDQITKNFAMDFSYFEEEIMNTKICKIYRKFFSLTSIIQ